MNEGSIRYQTFRAEAIYEMLPDSDYFYNSSGKFFPMFYSPRFGLLCQ